MPILYCRSPRSSFFKFIIGLECVLSHFNHVQLFAALWTVAWQAPLSMRFSRQKYWRGLPRPLPEDLPNPGIRPTSSVAPELQADSLPLSHWGRPTVGHIAIITAVIMWLSNTDQLDSPKSELFVPSILFPHLLTLLLLDTTHSPGRHLVYSLLLITSKAHPHWPQIHLNQFKW